MARRAFGEGSITRRKDGRWEARLQRDGRRICIYGKTQGEVAEKLRKLTTQTQTVGQMPDTGKQTVSEYLDEWLTQAKPRLRPTTWALYEGVARLHITPHIGTVKLTRLTTLQLMRFYSALRTSGVSARRVQTAHRLLRKALGDAVKWGVLVANPAAAAESPAYHPAERTLWTPEQIRRLLEAVEAGNGGQYGFLFGFLLASGCRLGEALGLRWSDADLQAKTIRIERQITRIGSRTSEQPPKTRAGIRSIGLPEWCISLLKKQRVQVATWKLAAGGEWHGADRVFPNSIGNVPSPSDLRKSFRRLCARLDLPAIRIHDLRHLSISLLAMAGVPVKIAQARAGHSSATITMQVYSHVLGDGDRQAAEALERALG